MSNYSYYRDVSDDQLREMSEDDQRAVMESWFRSRFEDPAVRTPYETAEGGYIWIWGGPFEAEDELHGEFDGVVPDSVIDELAGELSDESWQWAPVAQDSDYDNTLLEVVNANVKAQPTFAEATKNIELLLDVQCNPSLVAALNRMLYANVIAALETYLSDTFINRVLSEDVALRKFIETTPEFNKQTITYSEVFKAADSAKQEARRYLLDVVWHNIAKVHAMYRDTLDVTLSAGLSVVATAIPLRHDIVHRNGRDKDGILISVSAADVRSLVKNATDLVADIEKQLESTF